jgi:hypothetical protein
MKTYLTLSAIALAAAATLSSGTVLAQAAAPAAEPDFVVQVTLVLPVITVSVVYNRLMEILRSKVVLTWLTAQVCMLVHGVLTFLTWAAGPGTATKLEVDLYGGYKTEVAELLG